MKNKGIFTVLTDNGNYVITYIEKGASRSLVKYTYSYYDEAVDYIKDHSDELDNYVTELKLEEQKQREEEERLRKEQEEEARRIKAEKDKKKKKRTYDFKRYIAGFLVGVVTLVGGHFVGKRISTAVKDSKDNSIVSEIEEEEKVIEIKDGNELNTKFREFLVKEGVITSESMNDDTVMVVALKDELTAAEVTALSEKFFTDELFTSLLGEFGIEAVELTEESKVAFCANYLSDLGVNVNGIDVAADIENIQILDEELSTEKFEELVANFAKPYVENGLNVTTEDITKFVAIVNIDKLAEENPELASQLFGTQTREEFLNDAAKIIGVTYMYNHQLFETEGTTENFIKISDAVFGTQREKVQLIEDYVNRIAAVKGNSEEVNKIVSEFLVSLSDPDGELSYLDDGVGFGMQVDIALILNSIARNDLNQENRDWLQTLTTSEKYVSNIFTVYDRCNNANSKTLEK